MLILKNRTGDSESFPNMDRLKDRLEECFLLDGKDSLDDIEVFNGDLKLPLTFETKINIGNWNFLTIKE